jgi:hypothetical protein
MKLTEYEARAAIWGDLEGWEIADGPYIIDQRRWVTVMEVVLRKDSGKYYRVAYDEGSTEMQECRPFECEGTVDLAEVRRVPVRAFIWEDVPSAKEK